MTPRCARCGRFFSADNPYDEFCGLACYSDAKAERERWVRRRDDNLREIAKFAHDQEAP